MRLSFRWRLFLAIVIAMIIGTTAEALFDYLRLQRSLPANISAVFETLSHVAEVAAGLEDSDQLSLLQPLMPPGTRLRLEGDSTLELVSLPITEARLQRSTVTTASGVTAELAVDTTPLSQEIRNYLFRDLSDDGLQIILSVLIALAFSQYLLRPVKSLTRAVETLSHQEIPEPVAIPKGNDELSQLAKSFNRMNSNIEAAFERERIFTRYASHELRTPISAMKVQLEALELELSPAEKVLPVVQRNLDRMQRVLEALLSLARAKEKNHEPIPLMYLLKETLQILPADVQPRVVIKSSISANLKVPQPYLVGQCIWNLVDNAIKYTPGQVIVTLESQPTHVQVRVEDQGDGVPEELLDKLTHTFFRLSSSVEGSGLGLAFVKHIVRTFGGDLKLRNTSTGLEVMLILPIAP